MSTDSSDTERPEEDQSASRRSISLAERLRSPRTIISFALAGAFIFFVFRNLDLDIAEIAGNILRGNPIWIALAFGAYYGVFPIRAWRWRSLMKNAGIYDGSALPAYSIRSLSEVLILGWFANCLVPAKLGDAYRGYLLRERAGVSFASTFGTIVAERFIDVIALVTLIVTAALLTFRGNVPEDIQLPLVGGGILVAAGIIGLAFIARYRAMLLNAMPDRFTSPFERLQNGVVSSFSRRGWMPVAVATLVIWASEGIRLYCVAAAFGVELTAFESLFVALLASLLTVVPLTPAGLGVVESGAIFAMRLLDVSATNAAVIAIVDRGVAYWSVIVVGIVLSIIVRRR